MTIWRLTIRPLSLQLTPWQSDTIFGSLCWAYLYRHGEDALRDFLQPYLDRDPTFLISDGIPQGYLPLPFTCKLLSTQKAGNVEEYQKQKRIKKVAFIKEAKFQQACQGESILLGEETPSLWKRDSQIHATINRNTGTTTAPDEEEEGMSLFQLSGEVLSEKIGCLNLYLWDRKNLGIEPIVDAFRDLEQTGFGKKKSSGMGAFQIESDPVKWNPPLNANEANGFISFSSFVPSCDDPIEGLWQTRLKHGKLGEQYAVGGSPFKTPWIVLERGSCFYSDSPPGDIYGRMLENLSEAYPEVVQYAFAFPVPIKYPEKLLEVVPA